MIYFHILNKLNMIPNSRMATFNSSSLLMPEEATADATNSEREVIRGIYDSITKFAHSIQSRRIALNYADRVSYTMLLSF